MVFSSCEDHPGATGEGDSHSTRHATRTPHARTAATHSGHTEPQLPQLSGEVWRWQPVCFYFVYEKTDTDHVIAQVGESLKEGQK